MLQIMFQIKKIISNLHKNHITTAFEGQIFESNYSNDFLFQIKKLV